MTGRTLGRRLLRFAVGALCLAAVLVATAHAPFVRRLVWSRLSRALSAYGVTARADSLDYNLLTLDVRIRGLSLAVPGQANAPFFSADLVHVNLPAAVLTGRLSAQAIEIIRPRVTLRRGADRRANWPEWSGGTSTGSPGAIELGTVRVEDLDASFVDQPAGQSLDVRGLTLELPPDTSGQFGSLNLANPARLSSGSRTIELTQFSGGVRFDGRNVWLRHVSAITAADLVTLDGRIDSVAAGPRLAITATGAIDLATIAAWISPPGMPRGRVRFDGSIEGPLASPDVAVTAAGDQLAWANLDGITLRSTATIKSHALEITGLTIGVAGGDVRGRATIALNAAGLPGSAGLTWQGLPLSAIRAVAPSAVSLAALADGQLDATWTALRPDAVSATLETRLRRTTERQSLTLDGTAALALDAGAWQGRVDARLGQALRIAGAGAGRLSADDLAASTLSGRLAASIPDVAAAWTAVSAIQGVGADHAHPLAGRLAADVSLGGRLASPEIDATITGDELRYMPFQPISLTAHAVLNRDRLDVDSLQATASGNAISGTAQLGLANRAIAGTFEARLPNLDRLMPDGQAWLGFSGNGSATATLSGTLSSPRVRVTASGDRLAVAGQAVNRWSTDAIVDDRGVTVQTLNLSQGSGQLSASGQYAWNGGAYRVSLTGRSLRVQPIARSGGVPVPLQAVVDANFTGAGTLADPAGRGRLSASQVTWQAHEVGGVAADIDVGQHAARVALRMADQPISVDGTLGVAPLGRFTVDAHVTNLDLAGLAATWLPGAHVTSGTLAADVRANGSLSDLAGMSVTADLTRLDAEVDGAAIRLANAAQARYADRRLNVDDTRLQLGDTTLRIGGQMGPDRTGTLTAALDGRLQDLTSLAPLVTRFAGVTLPAIAAAGTTQATLTARGDLRAPVLGGSLSVRDGRVGVGTLPEATGIVVDSTLRDGVVDVERIDGTWQGARLTANGSLPLSVLSMPTASGGASPGTAQLTVRVDSVTEAMLAPWLGRATLDQLHGQLAGSITLEADRLALDRVRGTIELDRGEMRLGDVALAQKRPTRIALANGEAQVLDWNWAGTGTDLVVRGAVPLDGRPALDLGVDGRIDLALAGALMPAIATAGQATLTVHAAGALAHPSLTGRMDVSGGTVRVADPRLIVTGLAGTVTADNDRVTVDGLDGMANGGTIRLSGAFDVADIRHPTGSLTVQGHAVALDVRGLQTELDPALQLATEDGHRTLSGVVTVTRGAYREPLSLTSGLLAALGQQGVVAAAGESSVLDTLDLDVRVRSADDLLVDNNYGQLRLGADVRVVGTPLRPGLLGRATVREGGQIFLGGNTYRIIGDGTIDFNDADRITPDLSLTATTRTSGYDVTLTLKGPPDTLRTDLTSDPPLGQADIVSLLVTGQTVEQLGGALAIPRDQVLGYLSGEFLGAAGRAVGLDTVRIQRGLPDVQFNAGLVATETDPSSRLTFGKDVTPDLRLIFSQNLTNTNGLTWIVSYKLRPNIETRVVSLDNGDRSYAFRHDISFGGGTATTERRAARPRESVVAISFTGDMDPALRERLKLKQGDTFDFFKWQNDRDRLESSLRGRGYLEAQVDATRRTVEGGEAGVALQYDVRRGPATRIVVEGYDLPSDVQQSLREAWTRTAFDQFLTDAARTRVRTYLTERGFLRATVSATVEGSAEEKRLVVRIEPGARTAHREIQWAGNDRMTTHQLESLVAAQDLSSVAWTDPERLSTAVLGAYRGRGMLAASVTVQAPAFHDDRAVLPVAIVEGPQFHVGRVTIEGTHGLADRAVRQALNLETTAPYAPAAIEAARQRLVATYRRSGFTDVRVAMTTAAQPADAAVDLSVSVTEGARHVLQDVTITGASRTNPGLIRRTLGLEAGQPVDLAAWARARSRLYDTGVFRRVDVDEEPIAGVQPATAAEQPVRAKVTLEEWPALRLRYGFQLSDELKPAGDTRELHPGLSGDVTYRNLFGRALSAGFAGRYEANLREGRTFLSIPALVGRPVTSNIFVSRSHENLGQSSARPYVTDLTDFTAEQRFRPRGPFEIDYSYNFERNHTFDQGAVPGDPFALDITVDIARLKASLLFDTRNDLIDATRGWFHSSSFEYSASALGSDVRFAKYVLQQYYYRPVGGGVVLASAGRLGLATAFGQELIPSERFTTGGGTTVRGFALDSLGPVDLFGTVGGDALLVLNQEVRFPVFKWFRGVGFVDAGNAFTSVSDLSLDGLRVDVGGGTRIQTPFALIRIDAAAPLKRRTNESGVRLTFSIGQAF